MITSKRNVYTACHLSVEIKELARELAKRLGVSVSKFIADAVEERIARLEAGVEELK
jgi:hypothetical protein